MNEETPTALTSSPSNKNYLSRSGFKLVVQRAPHLNFFVQKINIPGVSINPTFQPNPFVKIPHSGEHIDYESLAVTFRVDEDLKNWLEMYNWIKALGFPNNQKEYQELFKKSKILNQGIDSEIVLFVLSSHRNPIFEINFRNSFPISLSSLEFDSTLSDVDYLEATVVFNYISYSITSIN